ncbi:DegT/DnrJ/EryC1/StrS family aminotransferase [Gracilibacillus saliphilus]|uniref:DegT/DnrJ/EryC1/StrS family aminotransferase n=1 Tax=Gracilibacillus saliphilus TaxID=543890 RepID=UPI0013D7DDA7|nr:DegT/DnrJ/EryC1/StrS family aminotransferase [Gracilibacillus saliphilus]
MEIPNQPIMVTRPLLPDLSSVNCQLKDVWDSKWITNNGPKSKELLQELKNYLSVKHFSLFNNGTLALILGLKALKLEGEVITTPFTFPATVEALDWNGLTPVFCDIDTETLNIDANKIESLITDRTSAILGVHVFGNPCNVNKIQQIADKYNLKVIYDGAHVFGTYLNGKPIGEHGDMTMFSFHATKLFNTIEGGALTFKNEILNERLDLLKNFGIDKPDTVELSGLNAKLNEVQAAMGLEVLKIVTDEKKKRYRIKELYELLLGEIPGIRILTKHKEEQSSYQYFVIEVDEEEYGISRNELHEKLKEFNVYTRKYFYPLCSDFKWYKNFPSAQKENLPVANKKVNQVLAMPFYGDLTNEEVEQICSIIKYLSKGSR